MNWRRILLWIVFIPFLLGGIWIIKQWIPNPFYWFVIIAFAAVAGDRVATIDSWIVKKYLLNNKRRSETNQLQNPR